MPPQEYIDATLRAAAAPAPDHDEKPTRLRSLSAASWRYATKRVIKEFLGEGIIDLAALLTFFTVLSLAPALLVVYSVITLMLSSNAEQITGRVENFVQDYVPANYQDLVLDMIEAVTGSATGGAVALVVGVVIALWTSSAYVRAFSRCTNSIYDRMEGRRFFRKAGAMVLTNVGLLIGVVVILVSLALNATLVTGVLGPIAQPLGLDGVLDYLLRTFLPVWVWVKWPVILGVLMSLVAMLYYFTPNVQQPRFRWLSPGAVVAILGIGLAAAGLYVYFSLFAVYNSYGAVGAIMALLFTLWVFNIVLLLGVKIDVEVERARQLQAGFPAEEDIQLPPRDVFRVLKMKETQEQLTAGAHELRLAHNSTEAAGGTTDDGADAVDGSFDDTAEERPGSTAAWAVEAVRAADEEDEGDRDVART